MSIIKVKLIGIKKVDWCNDVVEQYAATPESNWDDTYDKYLVIVLQNGDRITLTEEKILNDYYKKEESYTCQNI